MKASDVKYKWSKLFAVKRMNGKAYIQLSVLEQQELLDDLDKCKEVEVMDSDCTCCGDHNGMVTNPNCILHGRNR